MNKLFRNAIIINLVLLVAFIYLDLVTWNNMAISLRSLLQAIQYKGTYAGMIDSSPYTAFQVGFTVGYFPNIPAWAYSSDTVSLVNLPLIGFIVTILVNLSLIWRAGKENHEESGRAEFRKPFITA